ncbi:hypothetical protein PFICI_03536 [Pestalotiopsis fici W106-1]|uniref:Uncharacterized protein n=1 Tax=Pestalotiopsis fici (strain W106-1 / CGMCC3.15140) TaxID=1229662 RepID=W3XJS7_PESFW|nr:uncharacterized protein PFICI_03536 [Pestalotiopsis fici W106-1]ETS85511.1 hypothetical protein PFICI_03536 [Pestalotiopsis fici W106-1]
MFGGLANLLQPATIGPPPKDVPPATPVQLPDFTPPAPGSATRHPSLVRFLQSLHRPAGLSEAHFEALGLRLHSDAPAEEVLSDPSFLPPTSGECERLKTGQSVEGNIGFCFPLCNGNTSPEARAYLERRDELSIENQAAFRTVRRIRPEPGVKAARLGNCYEFYRQLEQMAGYWDDSSLPPMQQQQQQQQQHENEQDQPEDSKPPQRFPLPKPLDASLEQVQVSLMGAMSAPESHSRSEPSSSQDQSSWRVTYRTSSGNTMPAEVRHHVISAFLKLVSYDFGCNISAPRTEPRLQLLTPSPLSKTITSSTPKNQEQQQPRKQVASYFPSGCVFLVRMPTTREAARAGIVEGPIAAVSARNTTSFSSPAENNIDFGRELIAALITAQHRSREGKEEKRFGEGKWWAHAKRWGGGPGGPIGREVEGSVAGDKDKETNAASNPMKSEKPDTAHEGNGGGAHSSETSKERPRSPPHPISPSSGLPMRGPPAAKKQRKTGHLSIYDNYRQVKLPAATWDKKARYSAIGKVPGADYDDVFVISSLFHHISVIRVRVPLRILDVLAGAPEGEGEQREEKKKEEEEEEEEEEEDETGHDKSWGELQVWRSKWFDLFLAEDRLEALRLLWGLNAWMMRKVDSDVKTQ